MKLCRFTAASDPEVRIGLITKDQTLLDLTGTGVHGMKTLLELPGPGDELLRLSRTGLAEHPLDGVQLLTPVESQEVWAAGVTYLRSKPA